MKKEIIFIKLADKSFYKILDLSDGEISNKVEFYAAQEKVSKVILPVFIANEDLSEKTELGKIVIESLKNKSKKPVEFTAFFNINEEGQIEVEVIDRVSGKIINQAFDLIKEESFAQKFEESLEESIIEEEEKPKKQKKDKKEKKPKKAKKSKKQKPKKKSFKLSLFLFLMVLLCFGCFAVLWFFPSISNILNLS